MAAQDLGIDREVSAGVTGTWMWSDLRLGFSSPYFLLVISHLAPLSQGCSACFLAHVVPSVIIISFLETRG